MKFVNNLSKQLYEKELEVSKLSEADFIRKRQGLVTRVKDRKKSRLTKIQWKHNKWKMLKGIKRFHKSTVGKRFHRSLGRFLATRSFKGSLAYREAQELVMPVTAILNHAFIEREYYMSISEQIDYELFCDVVYDEVLAILSKLKSTKKDITEHDEFLLRLCEKTSLIKAFADKYGRSEDEVEELWKKAKKIVEKEYKKTEDDETFFQLVVGVLKKSLGVKK